MQEFDWLQNIDLLGQKWSLSIGRGTVVTCFHVKLLSWVWTVLLLPEKKLRSKYQKDYFLKWEIRYWTSTNSFSFVDLKIFNASDLHWNTFLTFTQPLKIFMTVYRGGDCLPFVGSKNSILFEWVYFRRELQCLEKQPNSNVTECRPTMAKTIKNMFYWWYDWIN